MILSAVTSPTPGRFLTSSSLLAVLMSICAPAADLSLATDDFPLDFLSLVEEVSALPALLLPLVVPVCATANEPASNRVIRSVNNLEKLSCMCFSLGRYQKTSGTRCYAKL